jgi:hypothetical protein
VFLKKKKKMMSEKLHFFLFPQQMKSLNQEISVLKAKVRRTEEDNIKKVSVF